MEKLRLRDLKPYLKSYYRLDVVIIEFNCLVPVLGNSEILVPFRVQHSMSTDYYYQGKKWLLKKRLLIELAKELNKIVIFYNERPLIEDQYKRVIETIYKGNIPPRWQDRVLTIDILRKIVAEDEYLAR